MKKHLSTIIFVVVMLVVVGIITIGVAVSESNKGNSGNKNNTTTKDDITTKTTTKENTTTLLTTTNNTTTTRATTTYTQTQDAYTKLTNEIRTYIINNGAYSNGKYAYVFNLESKNNWIYTGIIQMNGTQGVLDIWLAAVKNDNSGAGTSSHIYLPNTFMDGYRSVDFQFKSSGYEVNGSGFFDGPSFNSSKKVTFTNYYGNGTSLVNQSTSESNCSQLVDMALDRFARASTWSMKTLGFNNYNY
ncbi:MAG: hypothetical protein K6E87_02615 [bacterium]|nr:hypothetical protein [bacterium]